MILCIPTETQLGITGTVYNHFGSAPFFVFYNTETGTGETVTNDNKHHVHGNCKPAAVIKGKNVDAIICGGMGKGALSKINAENVKVYFTEVQSVKDCINAFLENKLSELTGIDVCKHHDCNH